MKYKYYCVDCGIEHEADDIRFDLSELMGVRYNITGNNSENLANYNIKLGLVRVMPLFLHAFSEVDVKNIGALNEQDITIEYSLSDYLQLMGLNFKGPAYREKASKLRYDDLFVEPSSNLICEFLELNENDYNTQSEIQSFVQAILQVFVNNGEENEQDLGLYKCTFHVRPACFEDGSGVYSLQYLNNVQQKWTNVMYEGDIRGYCPNCGSPVLYGAGKHEHILVGLLGAQSAGKTSTIIAMMHQIEEEFGELGVGFPGTVPLHDKRFMIAMDNMNLYKNGWAVYKTDVGKNYSSFNGSLLLSPLGGQGVRKLITFIDIAGEILYDEKKGGIRFDALDSYPLIDKCNLYIVCSCAKAMTEQEGADVPPGAIIKIASQIYERRSQSSSQVSPMCIVLTKADQLNASDDNQTDPVERRKNVFENIKTDISYAYTTHLTGFTNTMKYTRSKDVRKMLEWCYKTYDTFKDRTYVTMLHTAAYGYAAKRYEGDRNNIAESEEGEPVPNGIDDLWRWVLTVTGLIKTNQGYRFRAIPQRSFKPNEKEYYGALKTQFLNPVPAPRTVDQKNPESERGFMRFGGKR